jgi:hypothetical protein
MLAKIAGRPRIAFIEELPNTLFTTLRGALKNVAPPRTHILNIWGGMEERIYWRGPPLLKSFYKQVSQANQFQVCQMILTEFGLGRLSLAFIIIGDKNDILAMQSIIFFLRHHGCTVTVRGSSGGSSGWHGGWCSGWCSGGFLGAGQLHIILGGSPWAL